MCHCSCTNIRLQLLDDKHTTTERHMFTTHDANFIRTFTIKHINVTGTSLTYLRSQIEMRFYQNACPREYYTRTCKYISTIYICNWQQLNEAELLNLILGDAATIGCMISFHDMYEATSNVWVLTLSSWR